MQIAGNVIPESNRVDLQRAVERDLLGPGDGPEEEVVEASVRVRYLVGQLAPSSLVLAPEEQDELPQEHLSGADDGEADEDRLQSRSLMPSSMGLTFAVSSSAGTIRVRASWGTYERTESEGTHLTETGKNRIVWKRRPAGGTVDVDLADPSFPYTPDEELPGVVVTGTVRPVGDGWLVTLFLVNQQPEPNKNRDAAWLFQPELEITSPDESAVFRRRPIPDYRFGVFGGPEQRAMAMLHRNQVEFAVGHGVSVHADVPDPHTPDHANRIVTRVVPWYDVPVTEPPSPSDPGFEWLSELVLDMRALAEMDREPLVANLSLLADNYETWLERRQSDVDAGHLAGHEQAASDALGKGKRALGRLRQGIAVLADVESQGLEAFQFANRVMWLQRVRSEFVRQVRRDPDTSFESVDVAENRSWYPFQLAFVLLAVPSLANPLHPERADEFSAVADLLWFPTGGGKTEAYLGVAAYAMALRRLQGDIGGYEAGRGVSVIMRYTLRLLTIQQFQRASALMCAMEVVRREAAAAGDDRWGGEPFRIGLWVGNRATPGRTADAEEAVKERRGDVWNAGRGRGTPAQLTFCPWSGHEIHPGRDIEVRRFNNDVGRTLTYCSDATGQCPFSRRQAPGEGLPVIVVDSEIYQRLPALVIATVDKYAQMPWRGEVQTLFGRVSGECPRHGFMSPDPEQSDDRRVRCTGRHQRRGALPPTTKQAAGPLRPPDLIIQDELHLISGPLGTIVGIYETAIDELCTWKLDGAEVHPKIIASTATIRRAGDQVKDLFLRKVEVFPPHGLDVEDNFFSLRRPTSEVPGRRYLGICAPGKSRPSVLIRVYVAFLTAAQHLFEQHGAAADAYMTLVGYFNSLRELGGMRRLVEDDVRTRAFRMNQPGQDLHRPGLAQRSRVILEELTSRRSSTDIPRILDLMETAFDPELEKQKGLDVVLATNMVSVGVDVQRLGLMVVAGQPKTTAEYIQATSRVGRRHPGLVCTVLNWARPRDLSHYESFEHYHATFYQHVEALSLTPFAPRAIDRALTGVFSSLVRLDGLELDPNPAASEVAIGHETVQAAIKSIVARAHRVSDRPDVRDETEARLRALAHEWAHTAAQSEATIGYRGRRDGRTVGILKAPGPGPWDSFTVLTSMRDVEPSAGLVLPADLWLGRPPDWEPPENHA